MQDRSTRFFGTDFSFEDLEERDVDQYDYKLLADEGGMWKIESRPRKSSQYAYSYFWIKKDNYTFVKIEAYNKKGLVRVIDYKNYEQIKGIWTARLTEVFDVTRKSRTISEVRQARIQSADEGRRLHACRLCVAIYDRRGRAVAGACSRRQFEQRGFIENRTVVYPQTAPNDSGRVVDELLFRGEASYKFAPWLTVAARSTRARIRTGKLHATGLSMRTIAASSVRLSPCGA